MKTKEKRHNVLNYWDASKFAFSYLKGYKFQFASFYLGWLFDTILTVLTPIVFGVLINEIVYYQNMDSFFKVSGVFVFLVLFMCILYYLIYFIYSDLWNTYNLKIRQDAFNTEQNAVASYMVDANIGDIIFMIEWQTSETMNFVVRNIIHTFNAILKIIFCAIIVYKISWEIGVVMTVFVPVSVFITLKYGQKIRDDAWNNRQFYGQYVSWLLELVQGIKDLRILGAQKYINKKFVRNYKDVVITDIKCNLSILHNENFIKIVNIVMTVSIYSLIAFLSYDKKISIGTVVILLTYFLLLIKAITQLSNNYMDSKWRSASIQKIREFINTPSEDKRKDNPDLKITKGEISFVNISFGYSNDKKVLDDFSLHITAGKKIAIVGESGCGKTTLTYILMGFYNTQKGVIKIDKQKLSECNIQSIRENIGLIQQDIYICDGTIRENIMLGNLKASEAELIEAYKNAGLYEFIKSLKDGIDTRIGEGGRQLSGGQKQRIAIARIYLKNPPIIIFDEATSALDNKTEEQIHKAWQEVLHGRTAIVIAHRLSSVMLSDEVAIIKEGKIIAKGIPEIFCKENEYFRELFAIKEV